MRYEPSGRVMHAVGTSRAAAPSRSIVLHHRAAYRYADKWWTGPRRLALPLAGAFLTARAGIVISAATLRRAAPAKRPKTRTSTG